MITIIFQREFKMKANRVLSTPSTQLPDMFEYVEKDHVYQLRAVNLKQDFDLLYKWMHEPHVIPQWQLNKSKIELMIHFEKMLMDDHQRLYIIQIDEQDAGYLEIYEAARDRLAFYYDAKPSDMGWHILLGEKNVVGKGHFRAVMKMMCFFIFENSDASKIVGEPDVAVKSYSYIADQIAFEAQTRINMPEKKAVLYHCYRENFLNICEVSHTLIEANE